MGVSGDDRLFSNGLRGRKSLLMEKKRFLSAGVRVWHSVDFGRVLKREGDGGRLLGRTCGLESTRNALHFGLGHAVFARTGDRQEGQRWGEEIGLEGRRRALSPEKGLE